MNPISMGRRSFVRGLSLAAAAVALPVPVLLAKEAEAAPKGPADPGLRLCNAIMEAKAALAEIYGCEVADLSKSTHGGSVFVLAALPHSMDRVKWHVDDGSPLVGTEADWERWQADYARLAPHGRA